MLLKGYRFFSFARNLSNKYGKKLVDTASKTGLDAAKITTEEVVHRTTEETKELIGNKIVEKKVKSKPIPDVNSGNVEEIAISEKRQEILNALRQVL